MLNKCAWESIPVADPTQALENCASQWTQQCGVLLGAFFFSEHLTGMPWSNTPSRTIEALEGNCPRTFFCRMPHKAPMARKLPDCAHFGIPKGWWEFRRRSSCALRCIMSTCGTVRISIGGSYLAIPAQTVWARLEWPHRSLLGADLHNRRACICPSRRQVPPSFCTVSQ